jgi:hypothetical protein
MIDLDANYEEGKIQAVKTNPLINEGSFWGRGKTGHEDRSFVC